MKRHYPIEALLRPPVEWYTAVSAAGGAFIAAIAPWALMMTPAVGFATALLLALLAVVRFREGLKIVRYQRRLRVLPDYSLTVDKIPFSQRKLFLGLGFKWTPQHTQRLRDTQRPKLRRYLEHGLCYRFARQLESDYEDSLLLKPLLALFTLAENHGNGAIAK